MQRYPNPHHQRNQTVSRVFVQGVPQPQHHVNQQSRLTISDQSRFLHQNQRISNVSSNKRSVATRGDMMMSRQLTHSQSSQRSWNISKNSTPKNCSRQVILQNNLSMPSLIQSKELKRPLPQNQIPAPVNFSTRPLFLDQVKHYTTKQKNPYTSPPPVQQRTQIPVPIKGNGLSKIPQTVTHQPIPQSVVMKQIPKPSDVQQLSKPVPRNNLVRNKPIQIEEPLVGSVSVQNFILPPRIVQPQRRVQNRLYKSAVFDRNASKHSNRLTRSTVSDRTNKKKQILIRCPHRSFISNKKIPIIGGYIGKDKSKHSVIRQLLSPEKRIKVLESHIIGTQLIEVIPTQIIKVKLNKEDSHVESEDSLSESDAFSTTSNPILDQESLIKQYPQQECVKSCLDKNQSVSQFSHYSNRSLRLSDHIKISVYRSPDVVIKKAQIIEGPKLVKQHVLRVEVEGKVISQYRKSDNKSNRSASPDAWYERSKQYNVKTPFNPYHQAKIIQTEQKEVYKFETIQNINESFEINRIQTESTQSFVKVMNQTNFQQTSSKQNSCLNDQTRKSDEPSLSFSCTQSLLRLNEIQKHKIPKLSNNLEQKMKLLRLKNQMKVKEMEQSWLETSTANV